MCQLYSTCRAPPRARWDSFWPRRRVAAGSCFGPLWARGRARRRGVAAQKLHFERHVVKPVLRLMGARVETTMGTRRLSAVGQGESTCAPPPRRGSVSAVV
jgi:hypothetical protein